MDINPDSVLHNHIHILSQPQPLGSFQSSSKNLASYLTFGATWKFIQAMKNTLVV